MSATTLHRRSAAPAPVQRQRYDVWAPLGSRAAAWTGLATIVGLAAVAILGSPPGRSVLDAPPPDAPVTIATDEGDTVLAALKPGWWPGRSQDPFFEPLPALHLRSTPRVTAGGRILLDPADHDPMIVTVAERYRDAETGRGADPATLRVGDRVDAIFDVRNLDAETLRRVRLDDPHVGTVELSRPLEPFQTQRVVVRDVLVPPRVGADLAPSLLLGTDAEGRDLAARLAAGVAHMLGVAGAAAGLAFLLGGGAGWLAARRSRTVVTVLSRARLLLVTFPFLLVALVIVSFTGTDAVVVVLLIAAVSVPVAGRRVRDTAVRLAASGRVETALASGQLRREVEVRVVLPTLIRTAGATSLAVATAAILVETSLGFLGLGPPAPAVSLGTVLADVQPVIDVSPGYALLPGLLIVAGMGGCFVLSEWLTRSGATEVAT